MPRATIWKAKPVTIDGIKFASKREAAYWAELKLREKAGEITSIELQPVFPLVLNGEPIRSLPTKRGLGRPLLYHADFRFYDRLTGRQRVIEIKGMDDPTSRLRRAVAAAIHKIDIEVVK